MTFPLLGKHFDKKTDIGFRLCYYKARYEDALKAKLKEDEKRNLIYRILIRIQKIEEIIAKGEMSDSFNNKQNG
jgi:hypothetical protein